MNASVDPALSEVTVYLIQEEEVVQTFNVTAGIDIPGVALPQSPQSPVTQIKVSKAGEGPEKAFLTEDNVLNVSDDQEIRFFVILIGVLSPNGFEPNPDGRDLSPALLVYSAAGLSTGEDELYFRFINGAPDLGKFDIRLRGKMTIAQQVVYGYQGGWVSLRLFPGTHRILDTIDVVQAGDNNVIASFLLDFGNYLPSSISLLLTGFENPAANGNGSGLTLYSIAYSAAVCPRIDKPKTCRAQIVHASPDNRMEMAGVWVNGIQKVSELRFRSGTDFMELPAGTPLTLAVSPAGTQYPDTLRTITIPALNEGSAYTLVMVGVLDASAYVGNPDSRPIDWTVQTLSGAKEKSESSAHVLMRASHQATDAPTLNIRTATGVTLGLGLKYGTTADSYISIPVGRDTLWLYDAIADTIITGYELLLSSGDRPALALVSGFRNLTGNGDNAATLNVALVDFSGKVTSVLREVNKETSFKAPFGWRISPMPVVTELTISAIDPTEDEQVETLSSITILNSIGQSVSTVNVAGTPPPYRLSTAGLAPGTYILYGSTTGGQIVGVGTFPVVH